VTVYGSGWLLELPLAEMSEKTDMINMVDIIHPPQVVAQTAALKNVRLTEEDVTGGLIEEVWKMAGKSNCFKRLRSLSFLDIPEYKPVNDPGLIISLNILSQLETLPEKLLRKKCKIEEKEYLKFREEIQLNHIRFLEKNQSVLITDITEIHSKTDGDTYQTNTIIAKLPSGKVRKEWIWDFDLEGIDFNQKKSVLKVAAIIL